MRDDTEQTTRLISQLSYIDTWKLIVLAVVTMGIYLAYYIRRQSAVINAISASHESIPAWLVTACQLLAFSSLALFVSHLVTDNRMTHQADEVIGLIFNISLMAWGFAARQSMHTLLKATPNSGFWFDGLWTVLLSPLYFNYRINSIAEVTPEVPASSAPTA